MQVWKYTLGTNTKHLELPKGAKLLCVDVQQGEPQLWVLVTPGNELETRCIESFATGQPIPIEHRYEHVGTFMLEGGALVFHVFEKFCL